MTPYRRREPYVQSPSARGECLRYLWSYQANAEVSLARHLLGVQSDRHLDEYGPALPRMRRVHARPRRHPPPPFSNAPRYDCFTDVTDVGITA